VQLALESGDVEWRDAAKTYGEDLGAASAAKGEETLLRKRTARRRKMTDLEITTSLRESTRTISQRTKELHFV